MIDRNEIGGKRRRLLAARLAVVLGPTAIIVSMFSQRDPTNRVWITKALP